MNFVRQAGKLARNAAHPHRNCKHSDTALVGTNLKYLHPWPYSVFTLAILHTMQPFI
jgi:hypothetical protein